MLMAHASCQKMFIGAHTLVNPGEPHDDILVQENQALSPKNPKKKLKK
jgi:hypothetical protein